jgi:hypothetical protein
MAECYILVKPHRWPDGYQRATVFLRDGNFFRETGGVTDEWGKDWEQIRAESIEHARSIAYDKAGVASQYRIYH